MRSVKLQDPAILVLNPGPPEYQLGDVGCLSETQLLQIKVGRVILTSEGES